MERKYLDYTLDVLKRLLACDSPSGFTAFASDFCVKEFKALGYAPQLTRKGGVLCELGGTDTSNGLLLFAHIDTLGAMVHEIKGNGRLKMTGIGGLNPNNIETESVKVYARNGKAYDGTIQLNNASVHVNGSYSSTQRTFDTIEVLLDDDVSSADDVKKLGIGKGCYVCVNPKTVVTDSGFIKSRYLDDKLSAAILLGFARYLHDENITPSRRLYTHFTVYEEIGHGASATMPDGITEILGVDMGCVGDGVECTEKQVSICAKDSSGPYNYEMTSRLIELAEKNSIDYAVDIYPYYSSDCSVAIKTYDVRHALIGAGVYASHGYERSHIDGLANTFELIKAYALL